MCRNAATMTLESSPSTPWAMATPVNVASKATHATAAVRNRIGCLIGWPSPWDSVVALRARGDP